MQTCVTPEGPAHHSQRHLSMQADLSGLIILIRPMMGARASRCDCRVFEEQSCRLSRPCQTRDLFAALLREVASETVCLLNQMFTDPEVAGIEQANGSNSQWIPYIDCAAKSGRVCRHV